MLKPTGSWVAMPTPFKPDNSIDYEGFELLIERQIRVRNFPVIHTRGSMW